MDNRKSINDGDDANNDLSGNFLENFWIIHRRIAETLNLFFPKYTAKNLDGLLLYTVLVMQARPFFLVRNRSDFPNFFH